MFARNTKTDQNNSKWDHRTEVPADTSDHHGTEGSIATDKTNSWLENKMQR